jgi:hypothetical protein
MAEYLAASGSRKVTELTSVSGVSGSTSMPIVMGGSTVRVSHTDFVNSTLLSQANTFTQTQTISSSGAVTTFAGNFIDLYVDAGNFDTFKVEVADGQGVQFFDWDGASIQTFLEVDTNSGPITIFRDTTITGDLTASLSFSNLINTPTLVSGSTQIISLLPSGTVSGSSQLTSSYDTRYALSSSIVNVNTASLVNRLNTIESKTGSYATTGSNTFFDDQTIVGNITFPSSSFISTTNASGGLSLSALDGGILSLNADGGEGDVLVGSNNWSGSLKVRGNTNLTGSLGIREGNINLSGSIYLDTAIWNYVVETYTSIPVTYGATQLTFTVLPDNTITDISVAVGAGGYVSGSVNLTITGTTFPGGTTPTNDIVFNIQTFESAGPVFSTDPTSAISYVSGTLPQRYDNISSTGTFGIGADDKHWTFDTSGSFNTPGDINVTGSVSVTETISTQILLTPQVLTGQLIVPIGFNGMLTGPVSNGGELTIENGSNLVII